MGGPQSWRVGRWDCNGVTQGRHSTRRSRRSLDGDSMTELRRMPIEAATDGSAGFLCVRPIAASWSPSGQRRSRKWSTPTKLWLAADRFGSSMGTGHDDGRPLETIGVEVWSRGAPPKLGALQMHARPARVAAWPANDAVAAGCWVSSPPSSPGHPVAALPLLEPRGAGNACAGTGSLSL